MFDALHFTDVVRNPFGASGRALVTNVYSGWSKLVGASKAVTSRRKQC